MANLKSDIAEINGKYDELKEVDEKRQAGLSAGLQAMKDFEIQERLNRHFEKYCSQYEFLKGDKTQGLTHRLTDFFIEHFAKRTRKGDLKLNKNGGVIYPRYKIGVRKNQELEDQCHRYWLEIYETIGVQTSLKDYLVASRNAFLKSFIWEDYYLCTTIKKEIHEVLDTANTIDTYLQEEIKPLLRDQLTPGNYRESGLLEERV